MQQKIHFLVMQQKIHFFVMQWMKQKIQMEQFLIQLEQLEQLEGFSQEKIGIFLVRVFSAKTIPTVLAFPSFSFSERWRDLLLDAP